MYVVEKSQVFMLWSSAFLFLLSFQWMLIIIIRRMGAVARLDSSDCVVEEPDPAEEVI